VGIARVPGMNAASAGAPGIGRAMQVGRGMPPTGIPPPMPGGMPPRGPPPNIMGAGRGGIEIYYIYLGLSLNNGILYFFL